MPARSASIFVSAVTDEFKSYRDALVKWLDAPGIRIETQERFIAVGQSSLVKISDYLQQCNAVVHLVGDRTGAIAKPAEVEILLETHRDLPYRTGLTAEAMEELSYTQWEAWLAIYHRKPLYIVVANSTAPSVVID